MENRLPPSASIAELARNSTAILARPSIYASQKESPLRVRAFLERSNDWLSSPAIRSKLSPNSETSLVSAGLSPLRSEEHTSELQPLMRNSYAVFCLKKKTTQQYYNPVEHQ